MEEHFRKVVEETITTEDSFLRNVSLEIWRHPELKYEEKFAHELLTNALLEKGFTVKQQHVLSTAFLAEYDSKRTGPTVAVICEYDALPKVGHACGHNLIAEAGLGAGIALKSAMERFPEEILGKVIVLGTPAEELGGGGKVRLIEAGVFNDIDVAMMVHPAPHDNPYPLFIGVCRIDIKFFGKESHACGYPWEGLNALDAAVACYTNLALLRQQIKPTSKLHAIITKGGDCAGVIPNYTALQLLYRAATTYEMGRLRQRVEACIKSAAEATGCKFSIEDVPRLNYSRLLTNSVLADAYRKYAEDLGVQFFGGHSREIQFMASTDMGNVSSIVPSIHPTYSIGTKAVNHSQEFTQASRTTEAHAATMIAAKSMAMLGLKALRDKEFLNVVKKKFQSDVREDSNPS